MSYVKGFSICLQCYYYAEEKLDHLAYEDEFGRIHYPEFRRVRTASGWYYLSNWDQDHAVICVRDLPTGPVPVHRKTRQKLRRAIGKVPPTAWMDWGCPDLDEEQYAADHR